MDERVTSLFQPDTLIPDQYLETFRRRTYLEPEKRLMWAVLEDGVACFQKYVAARDGRGKTIFKETEEWILEERGQYFFSFASICDSLGFNAEYLRRGLIAWKAATLQRQVTARVLPLKPRAEARDSRPPEPPLLGHRLRKVASR